MSLSGLRAELTERLARTKFPLCSRGVPYGAETAESRTL